MSFKKGFAYVFFSNVIVIIASFFTGFALPKILSIDTYADIKLFQLYVGYVGLAHLGYADGMYLKYGGMNIKDIDKSKVMEELNTFKLFQILISILGIIISVCIQNNLLLFCMISLFPINVANYFKKIYQATGIFDKYAKFTNINTLFMLLINIVLLFIVKTDNSLYYIVAYVIFYFIYCIIIENEIYKLLNTKNRKFDSIYLISNIKEGFPLMIGNFSSIVFTSIDRLFVQEFLGIIKFAYYSFAVSIENLVNNLVGPVSIVMYNYLCNHQKKKQVIFVKNIILCAVSLIIILIFPVNFIVNNYIGKYVLSLNVLIILFAAQIFSMIIKCINNNLYKAKKRQNRYFVIMIIIIIISILLNIILYNLFHTMEAFAIATLLTNIIWFVIGEFDFKEYRFGMKQYTYILIILISYLLSTVYFSTVIGFIIYLICYILATVILLNEEIRYILNEFKMCLKKMRGKKNV